MEKQVKQKPKPLKFLPKVASVMNFHNRLNPFSPSRDQHNPRRFSGPIVSNIPEDVRRKLRPKYKDYDHEEGEEVEPISPKVSCIGQIKQKKKEIKKERIKKKKAAFLAKINSGIGFRMVSSNKNKEVKIKKSHSSVRMLFRRSHSDDCNSSNGEKQPVVVNDPTKVPSLGQMKRFASGREGFKSFDWTAQIAPVEMENHEDDCEEEEEEVIIPFSAPILVGGGCGNLDLKPRNEVNLWKRRTMNPPLPLHLF